MGRAERDRPLCDNGGMLAHYLAYGSNLHPSRLRERVPSARLLGTVELPYRAVRFSKRSVDGSGKCTIGPGSPSQSAHAAVYRIDPRQRQALDRAEGLGAGYAEKRETVSVAGQVLDAFYYVATADWLDDSLQPYHWYKELVLAGARYHGFPQQYIAALEQVDAVDDPDRERREVNARLLTRCVAENSDRRSPTAHHR